MRAPIASLALSLALLTCSCGEAGVYYDVKFAPGFSEGPTTISVLGVYQDGRMSTDTWRDIDAKLAPVLGKRSCEAIWGDRLRNADPDLFEQVDRSTQSDGITEDMLDKFSAAAEGDTIMVISLHVRRGGEQPPDSAGSAETGAGAGSRGQGSLPGSRGRGAPPPSPGANRPGTWHGQEIRLAATLFSAKRHAAMGRIILNYLGTNLDDAVRRFVGKIGETIPGSACKGWKLEDPK